MPRVVGIDPGTVSIDLCGLEDGRVFLDASMPTADALREPEALVARLEALGPLDLIAGPSGYGLPLVTPRELGEPELRLAYLAPEGEAGGIGGLRTLARAFARSALPVTFTPGVVHLPTVPAHRKVNRVDMGTADKVCAAALAIHEQACQRGCAADDVSLILLELGGAFSAALAIERGQIVDGAGGSAGTDGRARGRRARRRGRVPGARGDEGHALSRRRGHDRRRPVARGARRRGDAPRAAGVGRVRRERGEGGGRPDGRGADAARDRALGAHGERREGA
jgi:hypothetical protein